MGQGACGGGSARSISGRCKISRNLRKRLECGAAIGPLGRGLGRAGEGRSEEVDGKYEGVAWQRGVVIQFPPLPAQLFPPPARKADHLSTSLMVHSPAHARSLAATFPRNRTLEMVRSDAMQAAVFLAKLFRRVCVCAVPWQSASAAMLCVPSRPSRWGLSAGVTQLVSPGLGEMGTLGRALHLKINWVYLCSVTARQWC